MAEAARSPIWEITAAMAQATASLQAQIADPNSQLLNEEVTYQLLEGDVWAATVRWECMEEIGERKR